MQKGENVISVALAAIVVLAILAIQRRWQPANLKDVASSAGQFILETAGIRGQIPEVAGYEKVKIFRLGKYRAALYRFSPAPVTFAPGRFVVYDQDSRPVLKLETLEGSKDNWTELYDFAGRRGLSTRGGRHPVYTRSLAGNAEPDIVIGQFSGGSHCCTTATVVELGNDSVKVLGKIEGLDGLPFEGLDFRKLDKNASWEIIAHRPARTSCGTHADAGDIFSVFAYAGGQYADQTPHFAEFLSTLLRQNLAQWAQNKYRSLHLLQTLTLNYAALGQRDEANRFFAMNLGQFLPELKNKGMDPNTCLEDIGSLVAGLPGVKP